MKCENCGRGFNQTKALGSCNKCAPLDRFSEFIRNASKEEKEILYQKAMEIAIKDQRSVIEEAKRLLDNSSIDLEKVVEAL